MQLLISEIKEGPSLSISFTGRIIKGYYEQLYLFQIWLPRWNWSVSWKTQCINTHTRDK